MMKCDIGCSRNLHVTVTIGFTQSINARDETFMAIYLKLHELSQNKKKQQSMSSVVTALFRFSMVVPIYQQTHTHMNVAVVHSNDGPNKNKHRHFRISCSFPDENRHIKWILNTHVPN